jgi:DNA mismatch repair protein MutH
MFEWDMETIRRDWEAIKEKVTLGKAHELSEGDTVFLRAARKGSGGSDEPLRSQPNSPIGAKARAFAFKSTYIDSIIAGQSKSSDVLEITAATSFEDAVKNKFASYAGQSTTDIASKFGIAKTSSSQKGFHRQLAVKMLANGGNSVPELERAGIELKTIRLGLNGKAKESMSFPGFKFMEIVNEEWEDSSFFEKLERKFLFVIFRATSEGPEIFERAFLWNMPHIDLSEAQRVWEDTKRRVTVDAMDLPKISESPVAHVRPKGRNGNDKIPTPQGGMHLKQAFWLNSSYINSVLQSL